MVSRGVAIIALPAYTRMLPPDHYGALEIVTVIASLAMLIVPLEVGQALTRFYPELTTTEERRKLAGTALIFSIFAYLLFFLVATVGADLFSGILLGEGMRLAFRIAAAYIAVSGVFALMQNQLRVELRSREFAILSLVYGVGLLGFSILFGYCLGLGLEGILAGQLLGAILACLAGGLLLRRSYLFGFSPSVFRAMMGFSLPLVPSGMATFFTLQANRLILGGVIGMQAVGLFGVAARVGSIVTLAIAGLQSALTPLIYVHYRDPGTPGRLARIFEKFVVLALVLCVGLSLFSDVVVGLLADARYAEASEFVTALALAALLNQAYIFFPGIALARRMHLQLFIFLVTATLSVGGNLLLVSCFGLAGAVGATVGVGSVFIVLWIIQSQKLYPIPVRWRRVLILLAAFLGTSMAAALLGGGGLPVPRQWVVNGLLFVVFACVAWWLLGSTPRASGGGASGVMRP